MTLGLYVHVPYCRRVCPYCDFFVVPIGRLGARTSAVEAGRSLGRPEGAASRGTATPPPGVGEFVDGLLREIELVGDRAATLATIHFGGGTPSTLTPGELGRIVAAIRDHFTVEPNAEITLEANPEDISAEYAEALVEVGVNRLTLGIQSLDDEALRVLGRKHRRSQALAALDGARAGGLTNLCVDLIFGVPGQSIASWRETVSRVLDARPEHVSAYELTIEEGTELARRRGRGQLEPLRPSALHRLFVATDELLCAAGYEHYEVSNYARGERFRSRHNLAYWRHRPYLGIGPAAHSFDGATRWWNHRGLEPWLADLAARRKPIAEREVLSPVELRREEILLGLRCADGFPREPGGRALGPPLPVQAVAEAIARKQLVIDGDRIKPTLQGMLIADELARQLCP